MNSKGSEEALLKDSVDDNEDAFSTGGGQEDGSLTSEEKQFLLLVERGDVASIKRLLESHKGHPEVLSPNCMDPLGRSALVMAIENENYDLIQALLDEGVKVKDALLHAIKEEYVEAVELLLEWEETHHEAGTPYSWEAADRDKAKFTPDITPLILAAHKDNYEILKILLDRGATLPVPHDLKCGCDTCVTTSAEDSLRYSMSRINAYRALASPSLICLSSTDPFLTAFELSWELRRLAAAEAEFRADYMELRAQCQDFATTLLGHARTSIELQTILNHKATKGGSVDDGWEPGEKQGLERLKLAIKYKQKKFVAHPSVQQLLAAMWYEGLPGFRRKTLVAQIFDVAKLGMSFPLNSTMYMINPESEKAKFMKKPFVKFITHASSYVFFLTLLAAASQRLEFVLLEWFGNDWIQELLREWQRRERGALPGLVETAIVIYVFAWLWTEIKSLWGDGLKAYITDLWNVVDFITNFFYVTWMALRAVSVYVTIREEWEGRNPYYKREQWDMFDPMLLSEGMFGAAMIFSFLKLVHLFSINPHLGPLQISLGRMIVDIIKFFFIYTLVLFAFGCGLNQLLWYYSDLERNTCYGPDSFINEDGEKEMVDKSDACFIWRRFANLFETSQSLFWASFGLVELEAFELQGIQGFTRFWGLLMFGSYSVINVIVLLNMLIAMMSTSYQIISERADTEWKFARSKLWISYFDEGGTVPAPFNMIPTMKSVKRFFGKEGEEERKPSIRRRGALARYLHITRLLVRRYISSEETKRQEEAGITEDDVNEIRQDISSFRYELVDVLRMNGMRTPNLSGSSVVAGKKGKVMERRLMKDFQIGCVETAVKEAISETDGGKDVFSRLAKAIGKKKEKTDWNEMARQASIRSDPIGSKQTSIKRRQASRRKRVEIENAALFSMDPEILAEYNPNLKEVTPATRVAYAKFKTRFLIHQEEGTAPTDSQPASPSARAKHFERQRSQRQSGKSVKIAGDANSTKASVADGKAGKSELEKSTEKLDETPVLKPIRAQMSLKKAAEDKAKPAEAKSASAEAKSTSAEAKSTSAEAKSTPSEDKAKPVEDKAKPAEDKSKPAIQPTKPPESKDTVGPATASTSAATAAPKDAEKCGTNMQAASKKESQQPEAGKEAGKDSAKSSIKKPDEKPSASPKEPEKSETGATSLTAGPSTTLTPAAKPSTSKQSDHTVVEVEPRHGRELSPAPDAAARSPSPSGKSAITGQTRTGWL